MFCVLRLCAYFVLALLVLGGGWAIRCCFLDSGSSPFQDMMTARQRGEELNSHMDALERRTEIRNQATAAVIAEEMDLHEAAAEFRRSDGELDWVPPMDKEESYRLVIIWVQVELERRGQVTNRVAILARLDREYLRLFGHPPVVDPAVKALV
jgi:hypothetical protein